jgi:FKBP-type peptidyl-prolyl cis-trans isomerase FkpA
MRFSTLIIAGCALFATTNSNAQAKKKPAAKKPASHTTASKGVTGYSKTADDLEYKFLKRGSGTVLAKAGDMIDIHVIQKIGDSVLMDSYKKNGGQPFSFVLQNSPAKGDITQGLMMMKVGDSAIFRTRLDTLANRAKQPFPDWANKNAYISWTVKLDKIKDKKLVEEDMKKQQEAMEKMKAEAAENSKKQVGIDDQLIQDYLKTKGITNAKKTASGLYYVIHNQGTGPAPTTGQKVTVNYTGINMQGVKFDSNVDPAFNHVEPFTFDLGTRSVIAGWDEGVALLNKGTKATLYIPSGMAYGANARGPNIPANAILIFDIELLDFK